MANDDTMQSAQPPKENYLLDVPGISSLINALIRRGYQVVGPTVRDGAIVYDQLQSARDLPAGWTDRQEAGSYRLQRRADQALFGYAVGPHSWKKFLHPPLRRLWRAEKQPDGMKIEPEPHDSPRYAFLGVRSCELHAIAVQDKVFLQGRYVDPIYQSARQGAFIVAVNCAQAGGTCFCVSMKTGPKAASGYDLALTEVLKDGEHYFVVAIGSDRGAEVLTDVPHRPSTPQANAAAEAVSAETARHMGRTLDTGGIKDLLYRNLQHPRWDEVAGRCLTCANCTMVCPTCFCTSVEDVTDLSGDHAERWRKWDSCFTMDFSYIVGGSVRSSAQARYRQWMTHKLATWIDQFGASGCVGCGRCITWCPAAIDITQEVAAIRATEPKSAAPAPAQEETSHHANP
jgi:ferredoxin